MFVLLGFFSYGCNHFPVITNLLLSGEVLQKVKINETNMQKDKSESCIWVKVFLLSVLLFLFIETRCIIIEDYYSMIYQLMIISLFILYADLDCQRSDSCVIGTNMPSSYPEIRI